MVQIKKDKLDQIIIDLSQAHWALSQVPLADDYAKLIDSSIKTLNSYRMISSKKLKKDLNEILS